MATIELTKLWITLASTGVSIAAPSLGNESVSGIEGQVRSYAGGRQRYVGREGVGGQLERTLRLMPASIAVLLESWCGQTVFVRDARGQSWWGVFSKVTRRALKGTNGLFDLVVTVDLVTESEGV
jgi:hypothetical protein